MSGGLIIRITAIKQMVVAKLQYTPSDLDKKFVTVVIQHLRI